MLRRRWRSYLDTRSDRDGKTFREPDARSGAELADIDAFVVNCPKCMNMFEDSVKSTGSDDNRIEVLEVIELVAVVHGILTPMRGQKSKSIGNSGRHPGK